MMAGCIRPWSSARGAVHIVPPGCPAAWMSCSTAFARAAGAGRPVASPGRSPAGDRPRRRPGDVLSTAVRLLVSEEHGHGYDLAARLGGLGFDALDPGGLYRTLRTLEAGGYLRSWWDGSDRGPARRMYELTGAGCSYLARTIDAMVGEAQLMDRLVDRFASAQAS